MTDKLDHPRDHRHERKLCSGIAAPGAADPDVDVQQGPRAQDRPDGGSAEGSPTQYSLLVGIKVTGFSTPVAGVSWELTKSEKEVAQHIVTFLEDRRLLFGEHVGLRATWH